MYIDWDSYDVVVIGSGGGGLRAAVEAAKSKAKTLVICKGKADRSGATLLAGANISADVACDGETLYRLNLPANKAYTRQMWFEDTLREGFYLNNTKLLKVFVETAGDRVEEMIGWGVKVLGMENDHSISVSGSDLLDTLYRRARELGVAFLENTVFTDLLVENGTVAGAVCADIATGKLFAVGAKAVVLATGGAHNLFSDNSGPTDLCGDGQAAAWRAGAELIDMEMISFCPTVTRSPEIFRGNILPYIFFSLGYGRLQNKRGRPFLHRYLSQAAEQLALDTEWNKMLLSYAIQKELERGGGTPSGGVFFSLDLYPRQILEELYREIPSLRTGIYADVMALLTEGNALIVRPAAHYFEGGVGIGADMGTALNGLYAAGECAGGMFGANRVSAATTEMLVEGAVSGASAAAFARQADRLPISSASADAVSESALLPFRKKGSHSPAELLCRLRRITAQGLSVIRKETDLLEADARLAQLEQAMTDISLPDENPAGNRAWLDFLSLRNLLPCAQAAVKSALLRKESRGVHIRQDCFQTDNKQYLGNAVVRGGTCEAVLEPIPNLSGEPEAGIFPYTDYIETVIQKLH